MAQDNSATPPAKQKPSWNFVIPRKLTIAVCALVLLSMCVFWLTSNYNTRNVLQQQADMLGNAIARQTAEMVTDLVLANDLISINVLLGELTADAAIAEAAIVNVDGGVIAASGSRTEPPRSLFPVAPQRREYSADISLQESVAGQVRIRLDLTPMEQGLLNNFLFVLAATVLMLIVAAALMITYTQHVISFPLRMLAFCLQGITRGEVQTCPEPREKNEVSRTIAHYNRAAEYLAQTTFLGLGLARQADAAQLAPKQSGDEITATVLCMQLSNFQYLASTSSEEKLVRLLNGYYFVAERLSRLYNATLCYCSGDEVVMNFEASGLDEDQCFYAICAGQVFLSVVDSINAQAGTEPPAKFRLAVHSGPITGGLWSPLNDAANQVFGKTLDTARRICAECPDNGLLVSGAAYESAGGGSRVAAEPWTPSDVMDAADTAAWLSSAPMDSFRPLVRKQAEQLAALLSP